MKLQNKIAPLLMASAILVSGAAQAAPVQGTEGADSEGSLEITITKDEKIQISELADIPLTLSVAGEATGSSPVCVYRSNLSGYTLTATGNSDLTAPGGGSIGTQFGLKPDSGATLAMEYTVKFRDADNPTGIEVVSGTPLPLSTPHTDATAKDCGGGAASGMNIDVLVTAEAYAAAANLAHAGTLTLKVAPE